MKSILRTLKVRNAMPVLFMSASLSIATLTPQRLLMRGSASTVQVSASAVSAQVSVFGLVLGLAVRASVGPDGAVARVTVTAAGYRGYGYGAAAWRAPPWDTRPEAILTLDMATDTRTTMDTRRLRIPERLRISERLRIPGLQLFASELLRRRLYLPVTQDTGPGARVIIFRRWRADHF